MEQNDPISALLLRKENDLFQASVEALAASDLPKKGDVLVRILFSCLNYKDALAITNTGNIIRGEFPFVPGIDFVGRVIESASDRFNAGDFVIGTGGGLGETSWGGLSTVQRISSRWIVHLPQRMPPSDAMAIGTAGLTAMLSVMAIEKAGVSPGDGELIVTGATGGVGSFAVKLLSISGYKVVACTGKAEAAEYLNMLGATRIIDRRDYNSAPVRAMDSVRWAAGVDTVGASLLSRIISQTGRHGAISVCGLAGGSDLNTTVFPLILRGVSLLGIDSNTCPVPVRKAVWDRLSDELTSEFLKSISTEIELGQTIQWSEALIAGSVTGRIVVKMTRGGDEVGPTQLPT